MGALDLAVKEVEDTLDRIIETCPIEFVREFTDMDVATFKRYSKDQERQILRGTIKRIGLGETKYFLDNL